MVIEFTTNSGCWWSVLFLICSCNINVIIFTYVVIIITITTILIINIINSITTTTCIGLSCTLYSFSSRLPCLPPALLTGLKMQSSDLKEHTFTALMRVVLLLSFYNYSASDVKIFFTSFSGDTHIPLHIAIAVKNITLY